MEDNAFKSSGEAAPELPDGSPEEQRTATPNINTGFQEAPVSREDEGNRFQKAIAAWRSEHFSLVTIYGHT